MGWNVLVVDDEPNMQEVTALALSRMSFEGVPLQLHYASSAQSAIEILSNTSSMSVVLLDVVMEHDASGLDLISHVRDKLNNPFVRFIVRTGQAGAAPESLVIQNYDIQEYLNKADLTVKRLRNAIISALRSYVSLARMERRREISDIILQQSQKLQNEAVDDRQFLALIANGIVSVFSDSRFTMPYETNPAGRFSYLVLGGGDANVAELRATDAFGAYAEWIGLTPREIPDPEVRDSLLEMIEAKEPLTIRRRDEELLLLLTFCQPGIARSAIFLSGPTESIDPRYLTTLASHARSIFESKAIHWRTCRSYTESARQLASIVELRLGGDEGRLERMSRQVQLLALRSGCSDREAQIFAQAAALHDVGKIRISDAILMKPTGLTPEEWGVIRTHPTLGQNLLSVSPVEELQIGAVIALEHHERWDGAGYPHGISGGAISLGARLTTIIDVHDRLISDRPYRKALSLADAADYLKQNAGAQFDPQLISMFFEIYDQITNAGGEPLKLAS